MLCILVSNYEIGLVVFFKFSLVVGTMKLENEGIICTRSNFITSVLRSI